MTRLFFLALVDVMIGWFIRRAFLNRMDFSQLPDEKEMSRKAITSKKVRNDCMITTRSPVIWIIMIIVHYPTSQDGLPYFVNLRWFYLMLCITADFKFTARENTWMVDRKILIARLTEVTCFDSSDMFILTLTSINKFF